MKYSNRPRHFAPHRKKRSLQKNRPGHMSSGKGDKVVVLDPFNVLAKVLTWLKRKV